MFQEVVEAEGHLIDSHLMERIFDTVVEYSGKFEVEEFSVGKTNAEPSRLRMKVETAQAGDMEQMLSNLMYVAQVLAGHDNLMLALSIFIENFTNGMGSANDLCQRHHRPQHIRHGRDRDQLRPRADHFAELFQLQQPIVGDRHELVPLGIELVEVEGRLEVPERPASQGVFARLFADRHSFCRILNRKTGLWETSPAEVVGSS